MLVNQCDLLKFSTFALPSNSAWYNDKSITHYDYNKEKS